MEQKVKVENALGQQKLNLMMIFAKLQKSKFENTQFDAKNEQMCWELFFNCISVVIDPEYPPSVFYQLSKVSIRGPVSPRHVGDPKIVRLSGCRRDRFNDRVKV